MAEERFHTLEVQKDLEGLAEAPGKIFSLRRLVQFLTVGNPDDVLGVSTSTALAFDGERSLLVYPDLHLPDLVGRLRSPTLFQELKGSRVTRLCFTVVHPIDQPAYQYVILGDDECLAYTTEVLDDGWGSRISPPVELEYASKHHLFKAALGYNQRELDIFKKKSSGGGQRNVLLDLNLDTSVPGLYLLGFNRFGDLVARDARSEMKFYTLKEK